MLSLFGSGIGRGIAIGHAYVLKNSDIEIPHFTLKQVAVPAEVKRFNSAVLETENRYKALLKSLPANAPKGYVTHYLLMRPPKS